MIELTPGGWYGLLALSILTLGVLALWTVSLCWRYIADRREEDHEHRMKKLDYYHEEVMSSPEARAAMADGSGIDVAMEGDR